jgi:hypothetical protein
MGLLGGLIERDRRAIAAEPAYCNYHSIYAVWGARQGAIAASGGVE